MRLPPESFLVVIAAVGALALGVGAVAALDGNLWGIPLALGGAVLLWWSVRVTRSREARIVRAMSDDLRARSASASASPDRARLKG